MGLKERLKEDLTASMRSRDEVRTGTIRMVLTAITNEEVAGKEVQAAPEFESCRVLAEKSSVPIKAVYEAAQRAAQS